MPRLDITSSVRVVARNAHNPSIRHWKAVLIILSYLRGTKDLGSGNYVQTGSGLDLSVYTNECELYTDEANGGRSVSGVAVTLGGATASWVSNTQIGVTLSTTEAEYVALGDGVNEASFAGAALSFIAPEVTDSNIRVLEDDQGAMV